MHRVVGFGLIFLLLGYLACLAIGGSTFSQGETVVINPANGADSSVPTPLELNIVTLRGFDGIQLLCVRAAGVATRMLATTEAVRQGLSASRTETIGWQRRSWSLDWVSTAIRWRSRTLNCVPSSW